MRALIPQPSFGGGDNCTYHSRTQNWVTCQEIFSIPTYRFFSSENLVVALE